METSAIDEENKMKLDANSFMLKSKGFFLYTISDDGNIESIQYGCNCNEAELLGLLTFINQDTIQGISEATVNDDYEELD